MTENEQDQNETEIINSSEINDVSECNGELLRISFGFSLEVALFLTFLGLSLSEVAVDNILMYRTCIHALHHSEDVRQAFLAPDKINVSKPLEVEVQKYMTYVSTMKTILDSLGPAILLLFAGVWSDTYGRKPLIVWSLFGMTLTSMLTVVYSLLDNLGPWWYIITSIAHSLTGGFRLLFTAAMCYITDITSSKNRSLRITILESVVSMGTVTGGVSSSYLLKAIGHVYLLLAAASIVVIAYAVMNVCVRESLTRAVQGGITTIVDFSLIKEMLRDCFKRRPNKLRAQILLLTFANTFTIFIIYGLSSLEYLYARKKLHWSMKEYTIFSASNTFVGSFIGVGLIQKILPVNDVAFSIFAFLSAAAQYFIKAFATLGWHMYFGAAIALFKSLSSPLIRSFLSKILPVEDIAKVFALMGAVEGIYPLFALVIFNALYNVTIGQFPGAIYILSGVICIVCSVTLGFVQYFRWRTSMEE